MRKSWRRHEGWEGGKWCQNVSCEDRGGESGKENIKGGKRLSWKHLSREGRKGASEGEGKEGAESEKSSFTNEKAEYWINKIHQADWEESGTKEMERESWNEYNLTQNWRTHIRLWLFYIKQRSKCFAWWRLLSSSEVTTISIPWQFHPFFLHYIWNRHTRET